MSVHVPAPAMFLPCPGEPSIPFETWLRMFDNYMLVINATGNAWPTTRKRATLLHCLGAKGQRIFYALPDSGTSLEQAVAALQKHFIPKVNVVVERHTFRKRSQLPHETVAQYIAALRALSVKCDFKENADEMLRDQLLEHLLNDKIRERLLLELDLTLEKATTLAIQMEAAAEQVNKMKTDGNSAPVQAIQSKPHMQYKNNFRPATSHAAPHTAATMPTSSLHNSCFRCGSDKHLANSSQCPAARAQCKSCNKRGHFARVCRSAPQSNVHELQLPRCDHTVL